MLYSHVNMDQMSVTVTKFMHVPSNIFKWVLVNNSNLHAYVISILFIIPKCVPSHFRWIHIKTQKRENHSHWTMLHVWCKQPINSRMVCSQELNVQKIYNCQIGMWLKSVPIPQVAVNCYKTTVNVPDNWIHHSQKCRPSLSIM